MGARNQLKLLLWKNFLLQKRRPIATIFELLLPIIFSAILVILRNEISITEYSDVTSWRELPVDNLPPFSVSTLPPDLDWTIAYAPDNLPIVDKVMQNAQENLNRLQPSFMEKRCGISVSTVVQIIRKPENSAEIIASSFDLEGMSSVGNSPVPPGSLSTAAPAAYQAFPPPVRRVLDGMAAKSGKTGVELVSVALATGTMASFTSNLFQVYANSSIGCFMAAMGGPILPSNNSNTGGNSEMTETQISDMLGYMSLTPKVTLKALASEADFVKYMENTTNLANTLAGAIFEGDLREQSIPDNLRLTLRFHSDPLNSNAARSLSGASRWMTHLLYPSFQVMRPREKGSDDGGPPGYLKEGFLALQHAIYQGIASVTSNTTTNTKTTFAVQKFPYPPYVEDFFIIAIQRTLPMLIMLSFVYTSLVIVRSVVQEKESKMKEYMMMMGLSSWLHWTAWFLKYIIFLAISCIAMSALYTVQTPYGSVLTYSDFTLVFVFLLLFAASTITLCFFMSAFFSKANVGAAAGGVLYGLTYMPYLFMLDSYDQLSHFVKVISCLLPNVAMANGCQLLAMFEGKGTGIQWNNFAYSASVDDTFTLLEVFAMLIFDCFFYMVLTCYVEGVRPGEYGIPKPWYFPVSKSYWLGQPIARSVASSRTDVEQGGDQQRDEHDRKFFEDEPTDLKKIVEIKNLCKTFLSNGTVKKAVNDLSMNMYEGQINVLLGHNGAGKTTTMSMLTGFFPPTSGEAHVLGHSITDDMSGVRQSLGLCPQFNILFDLLTVDEHLFFFARLKGMDWQEAKECVDQMRASLKLDDKANAQSHTLSGGMKRKLCVGIALSAGSKYVILDEPTSGMDPAARRAIWEVVQEYRSKCSMLLSTHFMDEADLLGDRISIMADGKLRCAGSSVFLKNKFGVGYHAILTKNQDCDINKLDAFFHEFVPECQLERTAGGEVSFLLPFNSSSRFPLLFKSLEERSGSLGITNFGATVTTLEEVFLRVTEDAETAVESVSRQLTESRSGFLRPGEKPKSKSKQTTSTTHGFGATYNFNTGLKLWLQQFYALLVKRLIHSKRNYKVAIAQLVVPIVFASIAIAQVTFPPSAQGNRPLDLTLTAYGGSKVHYTASGTFAEKFSNVYGDLVAGATATTIKLTDTGLADRFGSVFPGGDFNALNQIAASFSDNSTLNTSRAVAWFNGQAYHTPATSLAYLDLAYLRLVTGRPELDIALVNSPLDRVVVEEEDKVGGQIFASLSGFFIAFNVVLGFSFLAASFCLFLVRERVDRSSLLQTLAGVDPFCFWFSAFLWDFINFITPCLITVILFVCFGVEELLQHSDILVLLFVLYCWASLPLIYCLSFLFQVPSTALVRSTMLSVITGLVSIISVNILNLLSMPDLASTFTWIFLFTPPFCLGQGIADIFFNHNMIELCTENDQMQEVCDNFGLSYNVNYLGWESPGVGKFVTMMGAQGFVFFGLLFLYEFEFIPLFFNRAKDALGSVYKRTTPAQTAPAVQPPTLDEDVQKEKDRINNTLLADLFKSDRLVVQNLKKVYNSFQANFVAVDKICVGIPEAECFGLLGINGAGKTTTFKMLTGDYRPTSGTAFLDGFDIGTNLRKVQQRMGYCPQFDALIEQMTGTETLMMFARLKGVPEQDIPACVAGLGKNLHFAQHMEKNCGTYSGGNKRKLSTAIALVGNPPVVLLDEPSTGMDPGAKRMLWDALADVRAMGCSIVITSHSMEECEALCTRLGIMVNGQLRCLGGPQHLKSRFGQGYTVELKLSAFDASLDTAVKYMMSNFPDCELKENQQGLLTFHVGQNKGDGSPLKLSEVFQLMETSKTEGSVAEYTVSQTTLEQVFLSMAKWQRESSDDKTATGK